MFCLRIDSLKFRLCKRCEIKLSAPGPLFERSCFLAAEDSSHSALYRHIAAEGSAFAGMDRYCVVCIGPRRAWHSDDGLSLLCPVTNDSRRAKRCTWKCIQRILERQGRFGRSASCFDRNNRHVFDNNRRGIFDVFAVRSSLARYQLREGTGRAISCREAT